MKIILDTNVLISASIFGGLSADIFTYCFERHRVYISDFILEEYRRVLTTKIKAPEPIIQSNVVLFKENLEFVQPENSLPDMCADPDDNYICQLALYVDADYIITGDKEFAKIKIPGKSNTKIISPRDFWMLKNKQFN